MTEQQSPYGSGAGNQAPTRKRVRIPHLREMKERGEKWAMLTSYDMYTAEIFDEAGIPVLLVGDSASNNVFGNETSLPVTVDELIPLVRAVARAATHSLVVGGPAVRLLPGIARAGVPHRGPVHEGDRSPGREARRRARDGSARSSCSPARASR